MNDQQDKQPQIDSQMDADSTPRQSPIRPKSPEVPQVARPIQAPPPALKMPQPENPDSALDSLRQKMEDVANEFAQGKINRAQFNAIYGRYSEQRTIIERLVERNPDNPAWKQAAAPGHTSFLRNHFEARLLYYLVYQHGITMPLMMGGKQQPNMEQIGLVLQSLWSMKNRPKVGLARKDMGNGQWIVLALGDFAVTLTLFQLEPSITQANLVRDLHADFERANRRALERGTRSLDRFVFPQRALTEKQF